MKKKKIRIKKLKLTIFILIILLTILFVFNIFGIRDNIWGNKVQKEEKDGYDITTVEGSNISIPQILKDENITLIETGKIKEYKTEKSLETKHDIHTLSIDCKKTKQEITDYYKQMYPSSMTMINEEEHNVIVAGSATNLIKVLINENEYKIVIEQK